MFYAKRMTNELMDQLQVVCRGHHEIDLMELQDEIQKMHITTDSIPQYIAVLEKAHLQAERADMPIPYNYLMMVAMKAVLFSECLHRANEDFEDLDKGYKL